MTRVRIIPKVLVRSAAIGNSERWVAVRTRGFDSYSIVGDPVSQVRILEAQNSDEYMLLLAGRRLESDLSRWCRLVSDISDVVSTPLTVGGGISSGSDARQILASGADRVCIGLEALKDPSLLSNIADEAGRQAVIASLDVRSSKAAKQSERRFVLRDGRHLNTEELGTLLDSLQQAGAGQIHIHDMNRDGSGMGLDLDLLDLLSTYTPETPAIASGGCGAASHFADALARHPNVGIAASTFFTRRNQSPLEVRAQMANAGLDLRHIFSETSKSSRC